MHVGLGAGRLGTRAASCDVPALDGTGQAAVQHRKTNAVQRMAMCCSASLGLLAYRADNQAAGPHAASHCASTPRPALTTGAGSTPSRRRRWCTTRPPARTPPQSTGRRGVRRPNTCHMHRGTSGNEHQMLRGTLGREKTGRQSTCWLLVPIWRLQVAQLLAVALLQGQRLSNRHAPVGHNAAARPQPAASPQVGAEVAQVEGQQEGAAGAQRVTGHHEAPAVAAPLGVQQLAVQHSVLLDVAEGGTRRLQDAGVRGIAAARGCGAAAGQGAGQGAGVS